MKFILIEIYLILVFSSLNNLFSQENPDIKEITKTVSITSVWEVKTGDLEGGLAGGLVYPGKLVERYKLLNIGRNDYRISVVLHLAAGHFALNDSSYKAYTKSDQPNPNRELISKLQEEGVRIELCGVTMANNGWIADNLLPGIIILSVGAYARIIDLEKQGYSYIRY